MTERRLNANMHRIRDAVANSDWADMGHVSPTSIHQGYVFFDDALAAHDAEVAANALREAAQHIEEQWSVDCKDTLRTGLFADQYLVAEADRIEQAARAEGSTPIVQNGDPQPNPELGSPEGADRG